ncbi:MAG: hypothetical protein ABIV11_08600 [Gemmatimonadaceae bacterium]
MAASRARFTVLELFVVAVLVAAVGSVVVVYYQRTQARGHLDTVKNDLRNLAAAQDAYAADNGGAFMPQNSRVTTTMQYYGYAPSDGVTVNITDPGLTGWSATATHARLLGSICGIFVGGSAPGPPNPATDPGEPSCN